MIHQIQNQNEFQELMINQEKDEYELQKLNKQIKQLKVCET